MAEPHGDSVGFCEDSAARVPRRTRRTKDGSLYVFDPDTHTWRREAPPGEPPVALDASGGQLALAWAQFPVDFAGAQGFRVAGVPLLLSAAEGSSSRAPEQQQHGDTARSVWDGAVAMAKALETSPHLVGGQSLLELGAGRGVAGLAAARLGAESVMLTDLPYALKDLEAAATLNFPPGAQGPRVEVAELDWADAGRFLDGPGAGQRFDVVLAADVVWLLELVEPLVSALRLLAERAAGGPGGPSGSPQLRALVTHQLRAQSVEDAFLEAMAREGFALEWTLAGGSRPPGAPRPGGGSSPPPDAATAAGVAWHEDFTPDERIKLWCFLFPGAPT